jgi:mRNA-degrading endonuclease YafQ of YafQ-DinJ toxin-antitoxin module
MNIEFDNPKHEAFVNDFDALKKKFNKTKGVDSASAIIATINVLQAADTLADVPPSFRPHPLKAEYKGAFAVDVDDKHRVIFKPNHGGDPTFRIDIRKTIKNITIIEIFKDYH